MSNVPEDLAAVFKIIQSSKHDIFKAKETRIRFGKIYDAEFLTEWDQAIRQAEAALLDLEKLAEPAKLDLQQNHGKVKVRTRLMWSFKSSKVLYDTNSRLSLAHQRLLASTPLMPDSDRSGLRRQTTPPPPPHPPCSSGYDSSNDLQQSLSDMNKNDRRRTITLATAAPAKDRVGTNVSSVSASSLSPNRLSIDQELQVPENSPRPREDLAQAWNWETPDSFSKIRQERDVNQATSSSAQTLERRVLAQTQEVPVISNLVQGVNELEAAQMPVCSGGDDILTVPTSHYRLATDIRYSVVTDIAELEANECPPLSF